MLDGLTPPLLVMSAAAVFMGVLRLYKRRPNWLAGEMLVVLAVVCFSGSLQVLMGRPLTYRDGPVRFWSGDVFSDQNSQQFTDPYSLTHVIHGAAFYGLTRMALPVAPVGLRTVIAVSLESAWEVYENTDTVIERYRSATVSLGYYGDSVLNSFGDVLACLLGFLLTWRLPTKVTLAWILTVETVLLFAIRDNLTLNIVMLLYPIEAVRLWQMGG